MQTDHNYFCQPSIRYPSQILGATLRKELPTPATGMKIDMLFHGKPTSSAMPFLMCFPLNQVKVLQN